MNLKENKTVLIVFLILISIFAGILTWQLLKINDLKKQINIVDEKGTIYQESNKIEFDKIQGQKVSWIDSAKFYKEESEETIKELTKINNKYEKLRREINKNSADIDYQLRINDSLLSIFGH